MWKIRAEILLMVRGADWGQAVKILKRVLMTFLTHEDGDEKIRVYRVHWGENCGRPRRASPRLCTVSFGSTIWPQVHPYLNPPNTHTQLIGPNREGRRCQGRYNHRARGWSAGVKLFRVEDYTTGLRYERNGLPKRTRGSRAVKLRCRVV